MRRRYVLSPEAARDLTEIWRYVSVKGSVESADRVEATILKKIAAIARSQGMGHRRNDIADESIRFFPVYSYLIVYRLRTKPLEVVAIIHGMRNLVDVLDA